MRMVPKWQMAARNLCSGKTLQETNKCLSLHSWGNLTDIEAEEFLKMKTYRTAEERKEFVRIRDIKYGIPGHTSRFHGMCSKHKIPEGGIPEGQRGTTFSWEEVNERLKSAYYRKNWFLD